MSISPADTQQVSRPGAGAARLSTATVRALLVLLATTTTGLVAGGARWPVALPLEVLLLPALLVAAALWGTGLRASGRREATLARRLSSMTSRLYDPVVEVDGRGLVRSWSARAEEVFGWSSADVIGRELAEFFLPEHRRTGHRDRVAALAEGRLDDAGGGNRRGVVIAADGREVHVVVTSFVLDSFDGPRLCALLHDETDRRALETELREYAEYDSLTGLTNRRVFRLRLEALAADPQQGGALMFIDLDGFKLVNDSFGHAEGDTLLLATAQRVEQCVATYEGATAARLGGDEFALLLPGVGATEARWLAANLVARLRQPFRPSGQAELQVGASIGVTLLGGGGGADDLLRDADLAMYSAKRAADVGWAQYAPEMLAAVQAATALEGELRHALEHDELVVHYQPCVDLRDGSLRGVEALVRWQHPTRGLLPPDTFIPLAEQRRLVPALGELVLRQACRQLSDWRRELGARAPQHVAVNVSPAQLVVPGAFVQLVEQVLASAGLEPAWLVLEITESALAERSGAVLTALRALRDLGVRLAIDDFGTGHSSLARLRDMPVHTLKVDRSFTERIPEQGHEPMVRAVLSMADSLALDVVVEGVETHRQLQYVRSLGAAQAQGFLLSRPVPAHELAGWIADTALQASFGLHLPDDALPQPRSAPEHDGALR